MAGNIAQNNPRWMASDSRTSIRSADCDTATIGGLTRRHDKQRHAAFRSTVLGIRVALFVEGRLRPRRDLIALMLLANDHEIYNQTESRGSRRFSSPARRTTNCLNRCPMVRTVFARYVGGLVSRLKTSSSEGELLVSRYLGPRRNRELAPRF